MTLVHWVGIAVSDNRKTIRDSRGGRRNSPEYSAYRSSVAGAIRAQCPGMYFAAAGLLVQFRLDWSSDPTNYLKGLLDGIQDSGRVGNDRSLAPIQVLAPRRRPRGQVDEAWLVLWDTAVPEGKSP